MGVLQDRAKTRCSTAATTCASTGPLCATGNTIATTRGTSCHASATLSVRCRLIYSIDLFYTILTSCNFLVMLYVPSIITYFAKYLYFYALIYLNVYIHIREHLQFYYPKLLSFSFY